MLDARMCRAQGRLDITGPLSGVLVGTRLFCFRDFDLPLIAIRQKQLIYYYLLIVNVENKNYCFLKLLFS